MTLVQIPIVMLRFSLSSGGGARISGTAKIPMKIESSNRLFFPTLQLGKSGRQSKKFNQNKRLKIYSQHDEYSDTNIVK